MSVKIIFYDLNQPDTTPAYKDLVKYLMGLDDWAQPLATVWVVDTPKSAQVLRDEIKPFITDTDRLFVAEWYPGSGWASRNIPPVAAEWIRMRESIKDIDQYKLPPSMIPPVGPDYTPPPPPPPSQEFLEARGEITPEGEAETTVEPAVAAAPAENPGTEQLQPLENPTAGADNPVNPPAPDNSQQPGTISIEHEESQPAAQSNEPPANPTV